MPVYIWSLPERFFVHILQCTSPVSSKWSQPFNLWLCAVPGSPTGSGHPVTAFQKALQASGIWSRSVTSTARRSISCFGQLEQFPRAAWGTQITITCFLTIQKTANQQDQETLGLKGPYPPLCGYGLDHGDFYMKRKYPEILGSYCQIGFWGGKTSRSFWDQGWPVWWQACIHARFSKQETKPTHYL